MPRSRMRRRSTRLGNLILGLVLAVVLIIGAGIVFLLTLDINDYKDDITAAVQEETGRELTIDSPITLGVSLTPTLVMKDVRLANASWGTSPDMVRVRQFEIKVRLLPLIDGEIEVEKLILDGAEILLETNAAGVGNWTLGEAATGEAGAPETEGGPTPIVLPERLEIKESRITYRDGASGESHSVDAKSITMKADGSDAPMAVAWDIVVDDTAIKGKGALGSIHALRSATAPYPVTLKAEAFGVSLSVDGTIANLTTRPAPDVAIEVEAASLEGLKPLIGEPLKPGLRVRISAKVKTKGEAIEVESFDAALGDSKMSGKATFMPAAARPRIEATIAAEKIDLAGLLPGEAKKAPAAPPAKAPKDRVFPDDPLPVAPLKEMDAVIDLKAAEIVTPSATVRDAHIALRLDNGRLAVKPLSARVAEATLSGSLTLDARGSVPAISLDLDASRFDVGPLLAEIGAGKIMEAKGDYKLDVSGRGRSVAAIMASLDGESKLLIGKGRVKTDGLETLIGGLTSVLGTVFSGGSGWSVLNCVASDLVFEKGIGTNRVLLLDTEVSAIVGEGTVNLRNETLAMKVSPHAKSITLNVAVPVRIGGTLANPTFAPDELATARKLGSLVGTFFFPPAALAGLADLGSGGNECLQTGSKASEGGGSKSRDSGGVKGAVEGLGTAVEKGLKGLFGR